MPLFGTRRLERFEENIGALDITLTTDDLAEIEAAQFRPTGERYAEAMLKRSGL